MKKKPAPLRDKDMPTSNRVRLVRWRLKMFERKNAPGTRFPLEIYHPGD